MSLSYTAPDGFDVVTRHIVMERHLNAFNNLFGGVMLSWLDEASALFVMEEIGYTNFVTVSLEQVNFKTPAHRGDAIVLYCRTLKTGRSSITIETKALVHEPTSGLKREVITCQITFVCLKDGTKFPYFESEEYHRWSEKKRGE
ncbi:MAG TPA: acyl-CoA thioesterase [Myxococcales bacterium]|nr:acyl-CoA thioesterase [Deltaproteobacteria bacterium]MBU50860.1 acyl-CoA thioesterase [Deltaproteobacteria bacterium]HAA54496.1 acyl-CoA thioesterase [Myxococcales bacterium]|tara:strand:+ start:3683 stop:4114 length:432 start_codon:yes stop_codon:yes gene_type:complete